MIPKLSSFQNGLNQFPIPTGCYLQYELICEGWYREMCRKSPIIEKYPIFAQKMSAISYL